MAAVASSVRRRSLLLLLVLTLTTWLCVASAGHRRTAAVAAAEEEKEEDDDDDDNEWDFLSDASVVAAAEAQRRAVPCAASLDASYLNDDYCDCADGSDEPETGACALVSQTERLLFQCSTDGQRVAAAFLDDGVCDCCDGSDEPRGVCADTCAPRRLARLSRLRDREQIIQTALAKQAESASAATARVHELREQFDEIAGHATALQRAFKYKEQLLESRVTETGAQPSQAELMELRLMYARLHEWQYRAYVHSRVVAPETFHQTLDREPFALLVGACFTHTVNEKQLKGGSANVIPREYVIVFCPFQNITQTEPGYAQWQRAERESKTGVREEEEVGEETPPAITMGLWNEWKEYTMEHEGEDGDAARVVLRQQFDHGEQCANGKERRVDVVVVCGPEHRVVSVEEPAMCEYALRFETPAACSSEDALLVAKAIRAIDNSDSSSQENVVSRGHEEL